MHFPRASYLLHYTRPFLTLYNEISFVSFGFMRIYRKRYHLIYTIRIKICTLAIITKSIDVKGTY